MQPDQNTQFNFLQEEKDSVSSVYEDEKFFFFLKIFCIGVVVLGTGFWFIEDQVNHKNTQRTIQSLKPSIFSSQEMIGIEPFVVRFKTQEGFQLTRIDVSFQVSSTQVSQEIQKASRKMTDHLIFILSDKDISMFSDAEKLQLLENEIATQLNLFLVAGKIETVELKRTFLN